MSSLTVLSDRAVSLPVAVSRHTVAGIVAESAALVMAHADSALPSTGRRFLSEAKRPDYSIRRARMFEWLEEFFEWVSYAPRAVATHPTERLRGLILSHQPAPVPCLVTGIHHENAVGDESDVFERYYLTEKTAVRIDGVIHGWNRQLEVTRQGLDIAHVARTRQTISLPGGM